MNDFASTLGTALRERVAQEHPDLDRLVVSSVRAGLRLRRRRRAELAAAGVAGVAAVAVAGSLLTAGGPARSGEPTLAAEPSTTATPSERARPDDLGPLETYLASLNLSYGVNGARRSVQVPSDVTTAQRREISALLPRAWEVEYVDFDAPPVGLVDEVPVTVPKGWTCEWFLVDDKASCAHVDGGVAGLVVRPGEDHAAWSSSPDKGGPGSGTYVTDVHDGIFISVQSGLGTTDAELRALRDGLVWAD